MDIKVTDRDSFPTLEAALGLPCSAQVFAKACSTDCKEPTKLLEVGGKVGFTAVELVLSAFTKNLELSTGLPGTVGKRYLERVLVITWTCAPFALY